MQITVNNVSYTYSPGTPFAKKALDQICFSIPDQTFVGIIGKTGSGKSTLIQLLGGLLTPTEGEIRIGEIVIDPTSKRLYEVRDHVGVVFQYPEHQLFAETVYQDIAFGPQNQGLSTAEVDQRVHQALQWVGLPEKILSRSPFELSGGQMRRVAIAGILAMRPKILILDEPTAGLDHKGKQELLSLLKQLQQNEQMTILYVTHDMDEIAKVADLLLVLFEGKLVLSGPPSEVFAQGERLSQWGVEPPRITQWISQLNQRLESPLPLTIFTIEELIKHLTRRRGVRNHG
jgi:energy-coupling factor transport system ATP-binding protein